MLTHPAATGGPATSAAVPALLRVLLGPFKRACLRRELEQLDDRMLADIGLLRSDIDVMVERAYRV